VPDCSRDKIQIRAKLGIRTKVLSKINTSCNKKYSLENPYSPALQKIKNSPVTLEPQEGTKAWRFRNLAPCQVTHQLNSNRPSPEHGILVVRAFFFGLKDENRLKTRTGV
jgi:hypothetical protein